MSTADTIQNLGAHIATTRAARDLSTATVAKILHTTTTVLTRWETGDMTSASYAQVLAAVQWIDPDPVAATSGAYGGY